jgi:5-methylcytosine-specific restriction endonuclease McrA
MVVESHVSDKQLARKTQALKQQIKHIARPRTSLTEEIWLYNKKVMGMQNYYRIATCVNLDFARIAWQVDRVRTNRLKGISRTGRKLTPAEKKSYGKSKMLRYLADEPLYPIGYVQHKNPMNKKNEELEVNNARSAIVAKFMNQPLNGRSIEYADNRISLFFAQKGKCAVTGQKFTSTEEIHCHHKIPKSCGGTDEYSNLTLVTEQAHKLIHATVDETTAKYLKLCSPDIKKLNELRIRIGNKPLMGKIED